ncbi:IS110 family transposase [Clostridium beijerinckii]|uniref:IS110 family transposase n=1 Tax=Clostridium beijerinckii TaxID=1520 RepID=UPI000809B851|nr:IS110 family transposase [Clostridium beijerinckii]OCA98105.1 transposase [Clostridium beijerinckii]
MDNALTTTLFIGIDVSSKSNYVFALDFFGKKLLSFQVNNNLPGSEEIVSTILSCLKENNLTHLTIAMESTSFYSWHLANTLSTHEALVWFKPKVHCMNPRVICAYKKSFIDMDKTDPKDAFVIADFARVGKITTAPWNGAQYIALQRLTRCRLHLMENISREKSYILSNIFLKFSELAVLDKSENPFSNTFGATSVAVLTEYMSTEELANASIENLVAFLVEKNKNRFSNPEATAKLLQKAARDSYRLDKALYDPLNATIAASLNCIKALDKEVKGLDKAIEKAIKRIDNHEFQCLLSIPGIGPVLTAGIISEIGDITKFNNQGCVAKYAGLTWRKKQSGNFTADNTFLTKTGNKYLRYYLLEAAASVVRHSNEYLDYYHKKYAEALVHKHKRALALTGRKLVRLIFALLHNNQLYTSNEVVEKATI